MKRTATTQRTRVTERPTDRPGVVYGALIAATAALGILTAPTVAAQTSFAVRGGLAIDPELAVVGFALQLPEFAPGWRVQPSADLGFGDLTVVGLNLDALYTIARSEVTPYVGGGLGVAIANIGDEPESDVGISLVGGLQWGRRTEYSAETRIGLGTLPELKLLFGYVF